ncbi:MAG: bifunctional methionine sulfoxide reductase B/A protein [Planctomycetes bacterium]|nr:bifunctional methionine sulfoxide reductase B/A protein [Planctomycetota bacterium]
MRPTTPILSIALTICLMILSGCEQSGAAPPEKNTTPPGSTPMVRVRVFGPDGKLTGPVDVPKLVLTDAQWQARLTPAQYTILRNKGTEPAFCGALLHNADKGVYVCAACALPLFETGSKFESGTGWPSFFKPIAEENVLQHADNSYGMERTETLCARCESHLGHVFDDGPRPTGLRFCMNSESLRFVPQDKLATLAEVIPATQPAATQPSANVKDKAHDSAEIVLAGGCFWCVEGVFEQLDGVTEAISGYAGGSKETANYEAVCTGTTGHAEAVKIIYDPRKISYEQLLKVHFATHDPTTLNRQGNDEGTQYCSAIFYASEEERQIAQAFIADLNDAKIYGKPIVTRLEPLKAFYPAEKYHQDYVCRNPNQPYIQGIALPKVEKVRHLFKDMVKPEPVVKP